MYIIEVFDNRHDAQKFLNDNLDKELVSFNSYYDSSFNRSRYTIVLKILK